jgi:hypothetical protein
MTLVDAADDIWFGATARLVEVAIIFCGDLLLVMFGWWPSVGIRTNELLII